MLKTLFRKRKAFSPSKRSESILQSEIRTMSVACEKAGGINMAQGICDLDIPEPVKRGAHEAIDQGINQYTRCDGLEVLRRAISEKTNRFNQIRSNPEKNVTVTCGSTGAFFSACFALLERGDEVIVFEPYYGYHLNTLLALEAVPRYVTLEPPDWHFDAKMLEHLVNNRTKAIVINTPANPCGKVFSLEELKALAGFAKRHDLMVLTDEIYEYFVYDGRAHVSPGALPEIKDQTVTISGYSKTFSITGWRIGHAIAKDEWAQVISYVNDLFYACSPAPLQAGVAAGIKELGEDYYQSICRQYQKKRDQICGVLRNIGMTPYIPEGSYYVLADAARLSGRTAKEKTMTLLEKTKVATVAGSAFYHDGGGQNLIRFCFAKKDRDLDEACERLMKLK